MSEGMSTVKKAIIGGVVAGAVLGGAYLALNSGSKKKEEEEEQHFGTNTHKTAAAAAEPEDDGPSVVTTSTPAGPNSTTSTAAPAPTATSTATMESPNSVGSTFEQINSGYNFAENKKNAGKLDEVAPTTGSPKEFPTEVRDGAKHFERLGVVAKLPSGWDCKQEVSPVPTASMITFAKPEFANVPPPQNPMEFGKVPVVLLSVEDIALEGLSPTEYAAKKKMIGMQQLMMMTQGMFQPRIVHEGKCTAGGPFDFMLEYDQPQPPMQIAVMDLFTVQQGFAYCLQIMAKPEVVAKFKTEFFTIAKGIDLYPHPLATSFTPCACLRVRTGTIESCAPPSWRVRQTKGMLVFHTLSQAKTDSIKVCKSTDEPVLDLLASATTVKETKHPEDVTLTVVKEGQKESKLVQKGDFAVIAEPLKAKEVTVTDEFLIEMATFTTACDAEPCTYYESFARGFRFEIANPKAMVMESRVGDGAILYSPEGLDNAGPQGPEPGAPALTIRVEDPSTDTDCMGSLDEWYSRISSEAAQDHTMQDVSRGIVAGRESVYFMSKDMVEVGPGQREERVAKIVIFMNEGRTHMLRWEASTGNYRKTERNFNALLESYQLF